MNHTDYCQNLYDACEKAVIAFNDNKYLMGIYGKYYEPYIEAIERAMKGKES